MRPPFSSYSLGFGGTFAPFLRASESAIAMACFGFVTFFPLRPLFSLPSCISCISVWTCLLVAGLYLRDVFFAVVFLVAVFFAEDFFAAAFFAAAFFVAFFVAMMGETSRQV